ncbi:MAG TPA: DUF5689 domain-containing protein [Chitinophagaceae bacterium]
MSKFKNFNIWGLIIIISFPLSSCIKDYENPADGKLGDMMTLFALKQAYNGSEVTVNKSNLGGASLVEGVIISDKSGQNIDPNSFVLQETFTSSNSISDVTTGIVVRLNAAHSYNLGDSVQINVDGAKLGRLNGKLTLSGIGADRITVLATNKTPVSRAVTQGMLHELINVFESTLVTINADVTDYTAGATFSGLKKLNDNTAGSVYVHVLQGAAFAGAALPRSAQFGGIAGFYNESGNDTTGAKITVMPRNLTDTQFVSGLTYNGFPESFESPDATTKSSYNSGTNILALKTGSWYLLQAILGNTSGSDKIIVPGKQNIRMQQNLTTSGYVQMNFDVPDGASKVTVFYSRYGTDARSSMRLEYSTNAGTTWTAVGANITVPADKQIRQAVWTVNITGPVRFRINKLGTGTSNNGRLNLDEFTIYKKL